MKDQIDALCADAEVLTMITRIAAVYSAIEQRAFYAFGLKVTSEVRDAILVVVSRALDHAAKGRAQARKAEKVVSLHDRRAAPGVIPHVTLTFGELDAPRVEALARQIYGDATPSTLEQVVRAAMARGFAALEAENA